MERTRSGTWLFILLTLLQGLHGVVCSRINPSANPARVGDNITFHLSPQINTPSGSWSFGQSSVIWIEDAVRSSDSRASVNTSTGELTLRSVAVSDSGIYRLIVFHPPVDAQATLIVLEPVSNVIVNISVPDPVEFNDTVTLTCSASGSSLHFLWRNVSSDITGRENIELRDDNRSLIISNVTRFDRGPFYCIVSNGISNETSPPQYLKISYGPDGMIFKINASNNGTIPSGSNITLSCSAQSSPPAQFKWAFNGNLLKNTGPELEMYDVQEDQSGNYTCWAHNNRTWRYSSLTEPIIIKSHSESVQPTIQAVVFLSFLLAVVLQ